MPKHTRIVVVALSIGLLLALIVIFFLPEQLPNRGKLFQLNVAQQNTQPATTNAELLQNIDDELTSIDSEYSFNAEPTAEDLQSPDFTVSTTTPTE